MSPTLGFGVFSGERMKDFKQRHNLIKLGFKKVTLDMEDGLKELGIKIRVPILKGRAILIYIYTKVCHS